MYRAALALRARFRDEAGFRVVDAYTTADDEIARARVAVGLADTSACGKIGVRGERVAALVAQLAGEHAPEPGRARRQRVDGTTVIACALVADEMLVLTAPAALPTTLEILTRAADLVGCAHVTDLTSAFAVIDVIGPRVPELLERLVPLDLSPAVVPPLALVAGELAHVHAWLICLDHSTLPAFRALVPREYGEFVWRALIDAGVDLGLAPIGADAHARLLAEI